MTSTRRTEFAPFVLDLLDFMEEKIREAIENETSRHAAIAEAAGAVAPLRDRLRENEKVQASFILLLDAQMYDAHAPQWWVDFARIDRPEFETVAAVLGRAAGNAGGAAEGRLRGQRAVLASRTAL